MVTLFHIRKPMRPFGRAHERDEKSVSTVCGAEPTRGDEEWEHRKNATDWVRPSDGEQMRLCGTCRAGADN